MRFFVMKCVLSNGIFIILYMVERLLIHFFIFIFFLAFWLF
jgi:hypothetical protein